MPWMIAKMPPACRGRSYERITSPGIYYARHPPLVLFQQPSNQGKVSLRKTNARKEAVAHDVTQTRFWRDRNLSLVARTKVCTQMDPAQAQRLHDSPTQFARSENRAPQVANSGTSETREFLN